MKDPTVLCIVVGDGRTPRTAALLAMRTRWSVVSIDPALHGLEALDEAASAEGLELDPSLPIWSEAASAAGLEPDPSLPIWSADPVDGSQHHLS